MMPCLMYPFEERKKPVEVSIQVFLKLKQLDNTRNIGLHKLCSIYRDRGQSFLFSEAIQDS